MIVKTRKNENGQQLYQRIYIDRDGNRKYFEEDVLSKIQFFPTTKERKIKFGNNRATTNGRLFKYINDKKHIWDSPYWLNCKKLVFENANKL